MKLESWHLNNDFNNIADFWCQQIKLVITDTFFKIYLLNKLR